MNKDQMYDYTWENGTVGQTCINWNQYYDNCIHGKENPFKVIQSIEL